MPTLAQKPAAKRPRVGRKLSDSVLPLPPATAPAGPVNATELSILGADVDFATIKRGVANRRPRAR